MPINLQMPDENASHKGGRRRRSKRKEARQRTLMIAACGFGLLGVFAAVMTQLGIIGIPHAPRPAAPVLPAVTPEDAPLVSQSVAATSTPMSDGAKPMVTLLSLKRAKGFGDADDLEVEYDLMPEAQTIHDYRISVRTASGGGLAAFGPSAARRDVVRMGKMLTKFGSRGPIVVWIESVNKPGEKVSNTLTIP